MTLGIKNRENCSTIIISDKWELRSDKYNWILIERYPTHHPMTKEPTRGSRETYHGTLAHVADKILNEDMKECKTLEEMRGLLMSTSKLLTRSLKSKV